MWLLSPGGYFAMTKKNHDAIGLSSLQCTYAILTRLKYILP